MPLRSSLLAVVFSLALLATAGAAHAQSPAPILVVNGPDRIGKPGDDFGRYLPEILRAEGLNEFETAGVGELDAARLTGRSVVLLGPVAIADAQVAALTTWVQGGGNLIAMRPDPKLAPLLGLGADTGDVAEGYIGVDAAAPPGAGITATPMQLHGDSDRWTSAGARTVATLYATATSSTGAPAVSLHDVGTSGGQAAAFAYDLARSVVQTRQGNPEWAGDERDNADTGGQVLRSTDLFFPTWVDFSRIAIPQADEQQRLLANLIGEMSRDRLPLPRFWYLPRGERAAVVMTGDDHGGNVYTKQHFANFEALSAAGCSVAGWECVRATSYLDPNISTAALSPAQAQALQAKGFELALHLTPPSECKVPQTDAQLAALLSEQLGAGKFAKWSLPAPRTNRTHCVAWFNWAGTPKVERAAGIRLDTNYYYWPASWVAGRPGLFTGSGVPMRFADVDGGLIDVYQAPTQLTDEIDVPPYTTVAAHIKALLDGALGSNGYYGAFTMNMHWDPAQHLGAQAIVAEAQARGVPVISADQLLTWLDGRNGSSFGDLGYAGGRLSFTVAKADGARGLEAMVPGAATGGGLISLTRDGAQIPTETRTVKGVAYAVFPAEPGAYVATYPPPPVAPAEPGPSGATPATDVKAPRIRVKPRRARVSRKGKVTLKLACPKAEIRCRIDLRLSRSGKRLARKRLTVAGGRTAKAVLRLPKSVRRRLARDGKLRARLTLRVTDAAGNARTQQMKLTLLAPASKS